MPIAPAVLRTGAVVAHVNDVAALPGVLSAFGQTASGDEARPLGAALAAHVNAMNAVRDCFGASSVASAVSSLSANGQPSLAKRLRAGVRARGALAHPDEQLCDDIRRAAQDDPWAAVAAARSLLRPRVARPFDVRENPDSHEDGSGGSSIPLASAHGLARAHAGQVLLLNCDPEVVVKVATRMGFGMQTPAHPQPDEAQADGVVHSERSDDARAVSPPPSDDEAG